MGYIDTRFKRSSRNQCHGETSGVLCSKRVCNFLVVVDAVLFDNLRYNLYRKCQLHESLRQEPTVIDVTCLSPDSFGDGDSGTDLFLFKFPTTGSTTPTRHARHAFRFRHTRYTTYTQ